MSLVTIKEARHYRYGFDVEGIVKGMGASQLVNKRNGDVAYVSNGLLYDGLGHFIKIAFWNDDIKKIRNNLKIRIRNAYTKPYQGDTILYKSKNGSIDILEFNPDDIFDDIEKFQRYHKDIKSFEQYYNFVENSNSDIYLGAKKSSYLLIIKAFITIQNARKQNTKRNRGVSSAISYLHQTVTLSPVRIQQILGLFGIYFSYPRILQISNNWNKSCLKIHDQKISHKITRKIDTKNNDEIYHFEFTVDELPEEITIDENLDLNDSEEPLCEKSTLEFDRKYKGYHNYYDDPWSS